MAGGDSLLKNPITGIEVCCQHAANGAAAELAIPLMKSRRRIAAPRLRTASTLAAITTVDLRRAKWGSGLMLHGSNLELAMSHMGHQRHSGPESSTSAITPTPDIEQPIRSPCRRGQEVDLELQAPATSPF